MTDRCKYTMKKQKNQKKVPPPVIVIVFFLYCFFGIFFVFVQKKKMVDGGQVAENRPVCLSFFKTVFYSEKRKKHIENI